MINFSVPWAFSVQAQITRGNNSSVTWTCYACQQINNYHIIHAYGCISEENASLFDTINYPTCTQVKPCMLRCIYKWNQELGRSRKIFCLFYFIFFINFQLEQLGCNLWNLTTGSMCYTLFTPCAYQLYKSESKRILVLTFKRNSIHTCHMHGWILTDTPNSLCTFKCCWKQC